MGSGEDTMADPALRLPTNAPGPVFVDRTCIDCAACRRLAPSVFDDAGGRSYVRRHPYTDEEIVQTLQAVVACPVGAIGDQRRRSLTNAAASFPLRIDGPVSELGFHARSSYRCDQLSARAPGWELDGRRAPAGIPVWQRRSGSLAACRRSSSHRDDVADAARYARHFGAERIIHARDRSAMPDAEIVIEGDETIAFGPCTIVPTPGHTRGHCVLHHGEYLFTGDHLAWDRERGVLRANRDVCWYDWPTQLRSVARLRDLSFCWVLPGHGDRVRLDPADMCMMLDDIAGVAISGKTAPS